MKYVLRAAVAVLVAALAALMIGGSAYAHPGSEDDNHHPSGNDRSVEEGGSGTQGKATSDPDDDGRGPDRSNGGADKPGGTGGEHTDDQDGNNGCGNDDDFEDDNEGLCGGKRPQSEGDVEAKQEPKAPGNNKEQPNVSNQSSEADITVVIDCRSVTVTSTKDISHIEVGLADDTVRKLDGLNGYERTVTFAEVVEWAKAKSGTSEERVEAMGDTCTNDVAGTNDTKTCPEGTTMVDGECVKSSTDDKECPEAGGSTDSAAMEDGCDDAERTPDADVLGDVLENTNDSTTPDVGGDVIGQLPVTGPAANGPEVLGVQLERAPEAAPAVLGAQFNRTAAAALARTGVGIVSLVALGLGLVTLGAMITRRRSNT